MYHDDYNLLTTIHEPVDTLDRQSAAVYYEDVLVTRSIRNVSSGDNYVDVELMTFSVAITRVTWLHKGIQWA
jgi:hypothetical protein